jgi:RNA polymerase sigma-70 factor, ECF subfamily
MGGMRAPRLTGVPEGGDEVARQSRDVPREERAADPRASVAGAADAEGAALRALDRGDRERALTVLMEAYGASLYRYCRQMTAEAELAADVHQTTFVQAYEGLLSFGRRSSLRTWLFGIARHRCLDALKSKRRRERRVEPRAELPEVAAAGADPGDRMAAEAAARALEQCLERLAPAARTAVLLRYQEGFSYLEMARVCRERPATLRVRVCRALPLLRACLESGGVTL